MTLEVGKRGRGSGPPGGGRGGGRGVRDGGRGVSRGFRGGDARGRGGRGRGDRGGRGFSRGGDRGGRGFSRGGDRGGRGFSRGGDRGGRGSSRGGDRGSFRGAFRGGRGAPARGAFVGAKRDFNGSSVARSKTLTPICHEIAHALQLRINYKSGIPTEEEVSKQLPGFHSRFQKATDSKDYFLLFKDIESLEAAKALLEKDDTVQKVDYMGLRAEQYQPESLGNRQAFVQFLTDQDLEAVKKLDDKIMSVKFMKSKSSCLVEFPTSEEAYQFIKKTTLSKDRGSLKYCMETTVMQTVNTAKASIQPNQIVLRDVPRKVTIKELAELFPDANSATVYTKTFPSSDYCHAALHFDDTERVKALLTDNPNTEILGKKIYFAPAYSCLLREMPKLGEPFSEYESPKKKDSEGSPKKKIKLEKDVNGGNEEEDEDEEGEGEDIEGEDIEGEDIEGEDEEGEDEEGEDEENEGEEDEDEGEEDEDEGEDENGKDDNEEEMESDEDDE